MMLDLKEKDEKILIDIFRKVSSTFEVWAFGSRVTGKNKPFSDVDICLKAHNPKVIDEFGLLELLKEEFEHSDLPFLVDITIYSRLSDEFKAIIDKTAIRLL